MKAKFSFLIGFLVFSIALPALACNFCSGKPKALPGLAQEPGSPNTPNPTSPGTNAGRGAAGAASRSGNSGFGYDLKNYQADGQRSNNTNWSSGDFFENR